MLVPATPLDVPKKDTSRDKGRERLNSVTMGMLQEEAGSAFQPTWYRRKNYGLEERYAVIKQVVVTGGQVVHCFRIGELGLVIIRESLKVDKGVGSFGLVPGCLSSSLVFPRFQGVCKPLQ
jgi:hypothetical protein